MFFASAAPTRRGSSTGRTRGPGISISSRRHVLAKLSEDQITRPNINKTYVRSHYNDNEDYTRTCSRPSASSKPAPAGWERLFCRLYISPAGFSAANLFDGPDSQSIEIAAGRRGADCRNDKRAHPCRSGCIPRSGLHATLAYAARKQTMTVCYNGFVVIDNIFDLINTK
jgi:hypothetical protein